MLDHVFTDAIGALRDALEERGARLDRLAVEERFQVDVMLGDNTWASSYGLPGEGHPPRVQADIALTWSTWSQSAFRNWYLTSELGELPTIAVELALRMQRLAGPIEPAMVIAALPDADPVLGDQGMDRAGPTLEQIFDNALTRHEYALELPFIGVYEFGEEVLSDGTLLDDHFASLGSWLSSALVRLGDLQVEYLAPDNLP